MRYDNLLPSQLFIHRTLTNVSIFIYTSYVNDTVVTAWALYMYFRATKYVGRHNLRLSQ